MKKPFVLICILLMLGLCLCACAGAPAAETESVVTPSPASEPAPTPTPTAEPKSFVLNGQTVERDAKTVDLRGLAPDEVEEAAEVLRQLTALETVELGSFAETPLPVQRLAQLHEACPQAVMDYSFRIYDTEIQLSSETLDMRHVPMGDGGRVVRAVMRMMKNLNYVDMDGCGLPNEVMAEIRDELPQAKVVWRIWFGDKYSVRTDVERILASAPDLAGELVHDNVMPLMYCTEVKYLDLGHNNHMDTIEFVRYMPELEVAILAMSHVEDFSPLADCPKLEYLELFTSRLHDLTPLSGLTNLRHLNICYCFAINDISPLYSLTNLERLWIGGYDPVPPEQIETMRKMAPDCVINTTTLDPTEEGWRAGEAEYPGWPKAQERYVLLQKQFKYLEGAYSFYYLDPDYYYGY